MKGNNHENETPLHWPVAERRRAGPPAGAVGVIPRREGIPPSARRQGRAAADTAARKPPLPWLGGP